MIWFPWHRMNSQTLLLFLRRNARTRNSHLRFVHDQVNHIQGASRERFSATPSISASEIRHITTPSRRIATTLCTKPVWSSSGV